MMEETTTSEPKKKSGFAKFIVYVFVLLVAIAGYAGAYYFYNQYNKAKIVLDNPEVASQKEVKEITDKLGKIYALPEGEEPTVATVLDKEKLKDQPFFAKAENGDKVIIFTKSQLAILFRSTEGKIINIAPVSLQEPQPTKAPTKADLPVSEDTPQPQQ